MGRVKAQGTIMTAKPNTRAMLRRAASLSVALVALPVAIVHAEDVKLDPIVVTATKTATKLSEVPASVTVITAEEIEAQGSANLGQILARTPGITLVSSGGIGAYSNVRMRGMPAAHSLVMIDGVRMNDPADSMNRGFIFDSVIPHNIERIEIVRGPLASLYGSAASGGVINIITKKGASDGFHGGIKGEYGSYATRRLDGNLSYGGKLDNDMPFTLSYAHSEYIANGPNISDEDRAFHPAAKRPNEDDRRSIYNHSLDFRLSPTDDIDGRVFLSFNDLSADVDGTAADAERNKDKRTTNFGTTWDTRLLDGRLENKDSVLGMTTANELYYYSQNPRQAYAYRGGFLQFEHLSTYHLTDDHAITGGVSYDRSRAERNVNKLQTIDQTMSHGTGMLQLQSTFFDDLHVVAGVSYESYGAFENTFTYRGGVSYDIRETGTTLRAGAGTGYLAPTVFQLTNYVNPTTLEPEKTTMFEAGFDQKLLGDRVNLGVTAFKNKAKDQIAYSDLASVCTTASDHKCYVNIDEMNSKGVEAELGMLVYEGETDSLDLHVGYTYTLAQFSDKTYSNHAYENISPHVVNVSAIYGFDSGKGSVRADATFKSRGWEKSHYDATRTSSYPAYDGDGWYLNLAAQYEIMDNVTLYGRVENLFDSEYYTTSGYTEAPFGVYAGIGYKF